jgi:hypothetical protein
MVDLIDTRAPLGNHVLAERMFRHDPRAMLYAPLHTVIWEDADGEAWFTIDQPSTQFSSLGVPAIDEVGLELDRKLARLLDVLDNPLAQGRPDLGVAWHGARSRTRLRTLDRRRRPWSPHGRLREFWAPM